MQDLRSETLCDEYRPEMFDACVSGLIYIEAENPNGYSVRLGQASCIRSAGSVLSVRTKKVVTCSSLV